MLLLSLSLIKKVVEEEAEVVQRLKAWVEQLASIRSSDPFVGLPVDEQSPVGEKSDKSQEKILKLISCVCRLGG